ncbi:MAG: MarR family transcriptional regulator [Zetaproteobacteria bacterium]|nr:MarR family transcriptional regulator [Zetaproteobacteria bacterium]
MSDTQDHFPPFKLEHALGFQINQVAALMTHAIAEDFSASGYACNAQDFGILYRIHEQKVMGQRDIVAMMLRDKATVTRRLDGLVKQGFLHRSVAPCDRRCYQFSLTDKGVEALQTMQNAVQSFQESLLAGFPKAQRTQLFSALNTLKHLLIEKKSTYGANP